MNERIVYLNKLTQDAKEEIEIFQSQCAHFFVKSFTYPAYGDKACVTVCQECGKYMNQYYPYVSGSNPDVFELDCFGDIEKYLS
jgi:hypothetical protein